MKNMSYVIHIWLHILCIQNNKSKLPTLVGISKFSQLLPRSVDI